MFIDWYLSDFTLYPYVLGGKCFMMRSISQVYEQLRIEVVGVGRLSK